MQVETYEAVETGFDGAVECDAEAIALIESLGLTGQQKLIAKSESGEAVRNPYRKMTAQEAFVYGQLLPQKCKLSEFADGPIPLRVLQIAAHAKDHFTRLVVWYPTSADVKDPLLIGVNSTGAYWDDERFILARWGEVLEPFQDLAAKACEGFRKELRHACEKAIADAQAALAVCDLTPDETILAGDKKIPSFG